MLHLSIYLGFFFLPHSLNFVWSSSSFSNCISISQIRRHFYFLCSLTPVFLSWNVIVQPFLLFFQTISGVSTAHIDSSCKYCSVGLFSVAYSTRRLSPATPKQIEYEICSLVNAMQRFFIRNPVKLVKKNRGGIIQVRLLLLSFKQLIKLILTNVIFNSLRFCIHK